MNSRNKAMSVLWALLPIALLPWMVIRSQQTTNPNILWLCEALHRFFSGLRLTDAAYENNPPLSLLVYTLPVLGQSTFGIPLHSIVFIQTCLILGIAAFATYKILSSWNILHAREIYLIVASFVLVNTIGSSQDFGERDHMIGIALMPFVLMQLTLTFKLPQAKGWQWPVFIAGTILILLKPHHGLLPTLLLLHRIGKRRDLSLLKDADFLSLAGVTGLYLLLMPILFPDWVAGILPDAIHLYLPRHSWENVGNFIMCYIGFCIVFGVAGFFIPMEKRLIHLIYFFLFAGLVSLIPYYVQGMGLTYHMMPALTFIAPAIALVILSGLLTQVGREIPTFFTVIFMVAFAYIYAPLHLDYPTYKDYADMPFTKILKKDCPANRPCSFFMFNRDMGIMFETAYYLKIPHASRFPSFWFLPKVVEAQQNLRDGKPALLTEAQADAYAKKYSIMVAQDFVRWKPDVVILWRPEKMFFDFDFIKFFSADKSFQQEWRHYRKEKTMDVAYRVYYDGAAKEKGPLTYDIYRRVSR